MVDILDLLEYDIFVDFDNGDKFYINDFEINEENKKIILKGLPNQLNWVKINEKYPIEFSNII